MPKTTELRPRMKNPAMVIPDAMTPILNLLKATKKAGVPEKTLELVHLRASQINGCSFCVDAGARSAKKAGESDERLFALAAWREAPYFTDAERAALALTEAATRLSDRTDPVPDEVWNQAAAYYDEQQLAALVLMIGVTNLFNRINATTRQVAGEWPQSAEPEASPEKDHVAAR
jgi:AhpD family alkylhydroperoxidase